MGFLDKIDVGALRGKVEDGVRAAQEKASGIDINVDALVQGAKDAVATGAGKLSDAMGEIARKGDEGQEDSSSKELVALLWCLAYADGAISEEERATLADISGTIDETYEAYAEEIEQEYIVRLEQSAKEFGQQSAAKVEAQRIIDSFDNSPEDGRLLCWNLLALANSDGLDESEADFIRFVGEKAGVDPAVFEELRNHSDAIVEISRSIELLRASDRKYAEIEPLIAEYSQRQHVVMDAIQALVTDR